MKRNTLNYLLDILLGILMIGLIATGLLLKFVLPPGSGQRQLWGMGRHDWGDWHFWIVVSFLMVLAIHLALHWQWVCVTTSRFFPRFKSAATRSMLRNLMGAATTIITIGLFIGFIYFANSQVTGAPRIADDGLFYPRYQDQHTGRHPGQGMGIGQAGGQRLGAGRGGGQGLGQGLGQGQGYRAQQHNLEPTEPVTD